MEVFALTKKLTKVLNSPKLLMKNYGCMAPKIQMRLDEFNAARNLAEIPSDPPPRCHRLKGKFKERFAVDVSENYRIVFEGYDKNDELTTNKSQVVSVQIISIIDYH